MFRRDYFMRQIEQLTVTLHRILFHKEQHQFGEAQRLLEEASRHLLGLNVHSLQSLSCKDILDFLTYQGNLDSGKALIVADLFREQGDLSRADEQPEEAYKYHLKSLELLLLLDRLDEEDRADIRKEAAPRIEQALERLTRLHLPADVKLLLFEYYDENGRFSKAEDVLFHYMEDHPGDELFKERARLFYERLLLAEEDVLLAGNLSKEEVLEGLSQLNEKFG